MLRVELLLVFSLFSMLARGQITYTLTYKDSSSQILKISIQPGAPLRSPVSFVMPRSVPGTYGISNYDKFIGNLFAINDKGERYAMIKDKSDAPRWYFNDSGYLVSRIEYEVNLDNLERKTAPSDASIIRPGFAGILNYSIFGWVPGTEKLPVRCKVETYDHWPIYSTTHPTTAMAKRSMEFTTEDYYTLADGQIFLGPAFRVKEYRGIVPLFVVSYSQLDDEYLDDYGLQGIYSMGILKEYFGELPFNQYSIMLIRSIPPEPGHFPPFGMEHLQSSTFFGDTSGIRRTAMSHEEVIRTMPTYLHHMGHSFIPLRCYGDTYRPYVLEIPPIINNIWFNEGFMWFLPYDTLKNERWKKFFTANVYNTAPEIKKLSLEQLSQTASTMYATDFRIGGAIYSRGALMAMEMDNYIKEKSAGKKSMKDVFRYLYQWSKKNQRPFTLEEFPLLISKACEIDLGAIYKKWLLPVEK